jgi:hypothetical protein
MTASSGVAGECGASIQCHARIDDCAMLFHAEVITAYCDLVHRAGLLPVGRARTSPMQWPCTGPSGRRPRCRGRNGRALRRSGSRSWPEPLHGRFQQVRRTVAAPRATRVPKSPVAESRVSSASSDESRRSVAVSACPTRARGVQRKLPSTITGQKLVLIPRLRR